jgi:hypothetical protein
VATIVDYLGWLVLPDTLPTGPEDRAVALAGFRDGFYRCLTRRADALFELTDALLCADGPVKSLVGLSLAPEHRRGHGAMYDALNAGRIDVARLRTDAATSPDRLFCHVYGRGRNKDQLIPGGRTRSSPCWSRAARRGRRCWTRSGWARTMTSPR